MHYINQDHFHIIVENLMTHLIVAQIRSSINLSIVSIIATSLSGASHDNRIKVN